MFVIKDTEMDNFRDPIDIEDGQNTLERTFEVNISCNFTISENVYS